MTHETNAPDECSPMAPLTGDVIDALAWEMTQHDALRDQMGLTPREGRRVFTRQDRQRGHSTEPMVRMDQEGDLLVKLEG